MVEEPLEAVPEFPSLDTGVTLLTTEERATGPLQSLVLDHVLVQDTRALWVDARNNAATQSLATVAPSRRVLERIRVARAFTAFQHYAIVEDLPAHLTDGVSLLVLPAVEWFYATDDLWRGEGEAMLRAALSEVADVATAADCPVLVTCAGDSELVPVVHGCADRELSCTMTRFGPRFSGADFETLVFECPTGVQTTLAFWRRVLAARHRPAPAASRTEVSVRGPH